MTRFVGVADRHQIALLPHRLDGLASQKWRALFLKEGGSDGRPEANLYPRVSC